MKYKVKIKYKAKIKAVTAPVIQYSVNYSEIKISVSQASLKPAC